MLEIPTGGIIIWSGSIAKIPAGFVLCDGASGTPDLRDKFVIGAGSVYTPGQIGGSETHNHDFTTDGHAHTIESGDYLAAGTDFTNSTTFETDTGTTEAGSSMPLWYALAYIMKT